MAAGPLLSACAAFRTPKATTTSEVTPLPATAAATAKPAKPAKAEIQAAPSRDFEQDKTRVKRELATRDRHALAPGEVGYYLDVLQGRIRQVMGPGVVLGGGYDRIVLDLSNLVSFGERRSGLDQTDRQNLSSLVPIMREYDATLISIKVRAAGHGRDAIDRARSRARSIAEYFSGAGVATRRILISDMTPEDANVRVEMQLEPIVRNQGRRRAHE